MQGTVLEPEGFCTASNDGARAPEQVVRNGHDVDALLHTLEARLQVRAIDGYAICMPAVEDAFRCPKAGGRVDGGRAADGATQRQGYRRSPERQRGGSVEVLLPKHLPRIPTQLIRRYP